MAQMDSILEEEMLHEDHIEAMTDDFESVDSFMDTEDEDNIIDSVIDDDLEGGI